ncbi:substrate-binding periplasmic protein [Maridesulfovibrio sp. FT414]|uniref:substrate-binding periplasmic protein n=1 Tax=Maridesulfovibrio sp. FT414 TaxID=2979469 RepID=UPI003D80A22C
MRKVAQNQTGSEHHSRQVAIKLFSTCAFLLLTFLLAPLSHAETLEIGYIEYPPYYYTQNGRPEGFLLHLTEAIMRNSGIEARYTSMPSKRVLHKIKTGGNVASIGWFKTEERERFASFSIPIYENRPIGIIFRKEDEPKFANFHSLKDLMEKTDLKIATISGHSEGIYVDKILNTYPNHVYYVSGKQEQLVKMLKNGRQDFCLLAPEEISMIIERCGYSEDDFMFRTLTDIPAGNKRYLIFSKTVAPETVAKINTAIADLMGNI